MSTQSRQGQLFVQTRLIKSIRLSMDLIQQHAKRSMDNRVDSTQFPGN